MFLDNKLLEICKNSEVTTSEHVQELNEKIIRTCEDYYKPKINQNLSNKEVKIILDRTFNLFDSFVRLALESDDNNLVIFGNMFKKFTFKSQFMSNKEMSKIYNTL